MHRFINKRKLVNERAGWLHLWRAIGTALLLLCGVCLTGNARTNVFDEYAVKAAYLYNFAKFVTWPPGAFANADAPLLICIAGNNPFGDALATLSGRMIEGHPVEARLIPTATGVEKCHIVFIGRAEQERFQRVLAQIASLPILTVSDIRDFTQEGGMIELFEAEQSIRFSINLSAARRANLNLSSNLLRLAVRVN